MRVLFSTTAGAGHFGPLVPFARACRDAGHDVRVAAPACFADAVAAAGFDHEPFDDVAPDRLAAVFARLPGLPHQEANEIVIRDVFGRLDAQAALPGVSATIESWRPDVLIREPSEFGSWAAAAKAGVPQIVVWIGLGGMAELFRRLLDQPIAELGELAGLPDDPSLQPFCPATSFTLVPATFDDTSSIDGRTIGRFRDTLEADRAARLPDPWGDQDLPLVCVTFGSVTATIGPFAAVYPAAVDALAGYPARVLLTTGQALDPESLGPLPPNVHAAQWWPQADLMPAASAVVGHGGFGTTMAALGGGVPQVVMPLFANDQFLNGARIAEIGAGIYLAGGIDDAGQLPAALDRVLGEPAFREAAGGIAAEIAALPHASAAVPIIERVAHRDHVGSARSS